MKTNQNNYSKEYYQKNKERILETCRIYRESNKEKVRLYRKNYREKNKEKILNKSREYNNKNKEKRKKYFDENKEKIKLYKKEWTRKNKENKREYDKVYRKVNKKRIRARERIYVKNRLIDDINFKLITNLRSRIRDAVKMAKCNIKAGSAIKDLGCNIDELKKHIESKFVNGMSWDNYGYYGWHLDHIKPLSSFNLTDRQQFLEASHYTNIQPLWAKDNIIKSDNY